MSIIPYEEHTVTYGDDAKSIFYLAAGPRAGPLIIFLHGWPGIAKTWHPQLQAFAGLGFRVVAPDMPGYGKSTARHVRTDYSQESVVQGALAVLQDTGRQQAIWVGHDWGCATVWTLANTRPDVCRAVASLVVPYGALERGMEALLDAVDRDVYPVDEYPHGQFSYQAFYEQSFDKAVAFQNKDPHTILRYLFREPQRLRQGTPSPRANVVKEGGWFGGIDSPPPPSSVKDEELIIKLDVFKELVAAMEKTGWAPADSYYMNHNANREYNLAHSKNGGKLHMPVLFIHARWDDVADSAVNPGAVAGMRRDCGNLTETLIEAGHHVGPEKAEETNAAIARWLVEEAKDWWPGFWSNRFAKQPYGQ
ncbi:alpha beta-hydrolase [Trichoderma arundinaceum]|uniref:Alpha beta-hydrolase n=1 Tax=Trichoderma arundinaceum TaxID=490622 RepID=A0A395NKH5_TRIAR|nr:alpha beta-hydrolase [Trichoderma arundinaceum]